MKMKGSRRRHDLLPFVVFAAVALFFTWRGFLPGRVLAPLDLIADYGAWKADPLERHLVSNHLLSDVVLQFRPWDVEARRLLRRREFPWVNSYSGDGSPLFANPQTALLSPFTWPRLLLGARGWSVCVFLKLLMAGLGLFWLGLELGMDRQAAIFAAAVFQASGFSVLWALHPLTNVFAVLPILAAALIRLIRIPSAKQAAAVVVSAAAATAGGHPETLLQGVFTIAILLLILFFSKDPSLGPRPGAGAWLRAAAAAAAGFLLLAIQLLPFFWLLSRGHILDVRHGEASRGFRFSALTGEILPGALGSPLRGEIDLSVFLHDKENFIARNEGFVGLISLVLIFIAWSRLTKWQRRSLLAGGGALAAAWSFPVVRSLLRSTPGLSLAAPERWDLVFVLFTALSAGSALMIVGQDESHCIVGRALVAAGVLMTFGGLLPSVSAAGPALTQAARAGISFLRSRGALDAPAAIYQARLSGYLVAGKATALHRIALPGACWALAGWALMSCRRRRRWLTGAALLELMSFGAGFLPDVRKSTIPDVPKALRDIQRLDPERRHLLIAGEEILPPNLSTLYELRDFRTFDLLESRDQIRRRWICGYNEAAHAFPAKVIPRDLSCLASEGVAFVLSREPILGTRRVGGDAPPAVGVYEIPSPASPPIPQNRPPRGLIPGAVISLVAVVIAIALSAQAHRSSRNGRSLQTDGTTALQER